ncbi:MAG: site-specific integrase, partial [Verrucomicrobia bacterium]|nr:site-specific integrase [Verrucomicrobiota bacterium]
DREPHGEAAGGPRGGAPVSEAAQAAASDAPGLETGAPISGEPAEEQNQPPKPPSGNQAWRLTMIGQLRLKHLSYRTEQTYLEWVSRFAGFLKGRNPLTATDEDVVDFLSDLAVRKQVAGSTQNQALNLVEG